VVSFEAESRGFRTVDLPADALLDEAATATLVDTEPAPRD
jgi:hypothetical protein